MFSALLNAQNRISSLPTTPITAVTWEYTNNGGSTYTQITQNTDLIYSSQAFTLRVRTITPSNATYTTTGTPSTTNVGSTSAQITITGTGIYTGSFTSPIITVQKANLSLSSFTIGTCLGFSVARMAFIVSGLVGGQSASLTTFLGSSGAPSSVAPVSTNDAFFGNAVSQITGANPISVTNNNYTASNSPLYLCTNDGATHYWIRLSGGANYNDSNYAGPVFQDCGS